MVKPWLTGLWPEPSPKVSWLKIMNRQSPWNSQVLLPVMMVLLTWVMNWFFVV